MALVQIYRLREWLIYLPVMILGLLAFSSLSAHFLPLPPEQVVIVSGRKGGMYYEYAQQYAKALKEHGIHALTYETAGTGENINLMRRDQAPADIGFAQGGYASTENNLKYLAEIESIAAIDLEPIWVFSHIRNLDSLHRLQGMRVSIGQVGSGSRAVALQMLEQVKLQVRDLIVSETSGMEMADALEKNQIDAFIFVGSLNSPVVQAALAMPGVYLAQLHGSTALSERLSYLHPRFIGAGKLNADNKQPQKDGLLLMTIASLVVRQDLHPAIKRQLANTAKKLHGGHSAIRSAGEFPHQKRLEFPNSVDATQTLRNGLPWVEEHFTVAQSQWIYRLVFIFLPLLVLGYLICYACVSALSWSLESMINRWYGELKFIENDLEHKSHNGLEIARFRSELRRIDAQIMRFHSPKNYMQRLVVLRQHVDFVNRQISLRSGR